MQKKFLILCFCFFFIGLYAQQTLRGKVVDAASGEPLSFANIIFNNNSALSVSSDINGTFSYYSAQEITSLRCSFIGYQTKIVPFTVAPNSIMTIALTPDSQNLNEVTVYPGENPAWRIMKKVIENKDINNPEKSGSFTYQCYNKLVADLKLNSKDQKDSIGLKQFMRGKHLFIMENVTRRKFIAPDLSDEEVLATKVSGFKNPMFASVATEMQPFSFYQDNIKLIDIHYLNPISSGSLKKYKFKIEDSFLKEKDTVFIISFEPKKNKNFDGLKGLLYINSNKYAVQNVIASPYQRGKINLKIQQQYQLIGGTYWFPEQLNYVLQLDEYPSKKAGFVFEGKSYLNQVQINPKLTRKEFALEAVHLAADAGQKDTSFWDENRKEKLNNQEIKTYRFMDSIGQKHQFDRYLRIAEKAANNRVDLGYVDLDLSQTFHYNEFEKLRLGTGFYTNEKISSKFSLGAFAGYGTGDSEWKYGYEANYFISKKHELCIGISHQNNLFEIGGTDLSLYDKNILKWRRFISSWFDNVHQNSIVARYRISRYLTGETSLNRTSIKPVYPIDFVSNLSRYHNTDLRIFLRFAYKEKITQVFNRNISSGTTYPILYFFGSKGIKNWFNSDLNYLKLQMAVEQSFYTTNFGTTSYRFESGYINQTVPLGLQFTGEGSYDSDIPYVTKNTFQTMKPYEFSSDRYAHLFLKHHFGTLLFKTKYVQPGLSIYNHLGWGQLLNQQNTANLWFKDQKNVFLEAGLGLDNLIKVNVSNIGYLGIGTAVFYRYGYYAHPEANDNLAYKITFQFSTQ
ncbi:carboxypeptidase-like regulatory domain-containing protein [Flavobacterium sp. CYK-55]|uniref:DUF5686 and carboxypeptidase-like regulatory domain-containing protein n=1 Tax=Flavobacterium sp. CYK-55 TaxID=2835529 RepID=UPI001BCCA186|nr:DUF5686 and carboxypeptidase-like regulatory domain-containing protein [Flavobacterium sp. CYK-55]MBS7787849.1 carboxypeptidase-like regulatory domain-containing protein [Flavobacterium sp. CYK-55]